MSIRTGIDTILVDVAVVEVPGIPPVHRTWRTYQTGSVPSPALTDQPLRIDWKPAGYDPAYYRSVRNYEVLPDLQPREGMAGWEFRSEVIWLTNSFHCGRSAHPRRIRSAGVDQR